MIEIKYRLWNNDQSCWIKDGIWGVDGETGRVFHISTGELLPRCIFSQYIGDKDKHQKEIYTGDIMKDENGKHHLIDWWNGNGCSQDEGTHEYNGIYAIQKGWGSCLTRFDTSKMEVVGNVFENPELLEEDSDLILLS